MHMDITYTPYIRNSAFKELAIKTPLIRINGYKPKYTSEQIEDEETAVESPIEDLKTNISHPNTNPLLEFKSKEDFKDIMIPLYESALKQKGLNPLFAKALVAQDGLESAWGTKAAGKYNFGGIKGKGTKKTTREVINGKSIYIKDSFKDFNSLEDYINYKVNLLNNNRYKAFSGSVNEFADKVYKGGYATDPNYVQLLNKIIASMQKGGKIKFQTGGVLQGKTWLQNWYKNRKSIIKNNVQQNQKIPLPITASLVYNILANNMNLTNVKIDPTKVPDDANGIYYPKGRKIYLKNDSTSSAIHEWTHSSNPDAQVREINKIKNMLGDSFYDQRSVIPDRYLDDPQEIYSRLMQLRYALKVSPEHKFTNEEIDQLKQKYIIEETLNSPIKGQDHPGFSTTVFDQNGNIIQTAPFNPEYQYVYEKSTSNRKYDDIKTFQILNRYSTDSIRMMLNDVADIDKSNKSNKQNV